MALHYVLAELLVGSTLEAAVAAVTVCISLTHVLVSCEVFLGEKGLSAVAATMLSSLSVLLHHVHH